MAPAGRAAATSRPVGIDWMTLPELTEAIPPAYTHHIGLQLIEHLEAAA